MTTDVLADHRSASGLLWPLLVLTCVLLSSGSQVLMKIGMSGPAVQQALGRGSPVEIILTIATTPFVIVGMTLFGLSAGAWLMVLSRMNLSQAYPCVALGIVVTAVCGMWLLGESLSPMRLGGIGLIVSGVLLTGLS